MSGRTARLALAAALAVPLAAGPAALALAAGPAGDVTTGVLDALKAMFDDLSGQVDVWLVGLVFAPLAYLLLSQVGLDDLAVAPLTTPTVTSLFPWQLRLPDPAPDPTALVVGLVVLTVAAVRVAHAIVSGGPGARAGLQALGLSLVLMLAGPAAVSGTALVYNHAFGTIQDAVAMCRPGAHLVVGAAPPDGGGRPACLAPERANSFWLLFSTMLPGGPAVAAGAAAFFALVYSVGALNAVSHLVGGVGGTLAAALVHLPVLYVVVWSLVMDAVGFQVLLAQLLVAASPLMAPVVALFAHDLESALAWPRLMLRAFLACALATAAGMLWGSFAGGQAQSLLSFGPAQILSLALYTVLALALWSVWTRPALLTAYQGVPAALGTLVAVRDSAGGLADWAARRRIPGAAALASVGRLAGSAETALRSGAEAVRKAAEHLPAGLPWQDPAGGIAFARLPDSPGAMPGGPPQDFGFRRDPVLVASDAGPLVRFVAPTPAAARLFADHAARAGVGVRMEGPDILVPAAQAALAWSAVFGQGGAVGRDAIPVFRYRGEAWAWMLGTWYKVPPAAIAQGGMFVDFGQLS